MLSFWYLGIVQLVIDGDGFVCMSGEIVHELKRVYCRPQADKPSFLSVIETLHTTGYLMLM